MNDIVTKYHMRTGNAWGTGVLIEDSGKFLVEKRTDTKTWASPGGKVEVGESAMTGLLREVREEVGLHLTESKVQFVDVKVTGFGNEKLWTNFLFYCNSFTGKIRRQLKEVEEVRWCTLQELQKLPLWEPMKLLLNTCKENGFIEKIGG